VFAKTTVKVPTTVCIIACSRL